MRFISGLIFCCLFSLNALAGAPKAKLVDFWNTSNEQSELSVDHSIWQNILDNYLDNQHASGINRVDYQMLKNEAFAQLEKYLDYLQQQKPTTLNKPEQKAYWINLYNATTVHLITKNLPVKSIKEINPLGLSFGMGPWNMELLEIEGRKVSLNDIEHGILRPIWQDNRLHYALNCASIGCPNLLKTAFTASNTEQLLNLGASKYINHPRAAKLIEKNILQLSSIYKWYMDDFGGDYEKLLEHLLKFANPELKKLLSEPVKKFTHYYDWGLNKP